MGSSIKQQQPVNPQHHLANAAQSARITTPAPQHQGWAPNNVFEMRAYGQPSTGRQVGTQLPAPATFTPRANRIRGGGIGGCLLITGAIVVLGIVGLAVGLGVGLHHHNNDNGNGGGGSSPTPTGGGAPAPTSGVTGGPAGTALANANLASIPLFGCTANDFNGEFSIGGQPFKLTVDSGSSTTAVAGNSCSGCDVSPEYAPGKSAVNTGEPAQSTYGDGSGWTGSIFTDTVVGGTTGSNKTAPVTMNIVSMKTADKFFNAPDCDVSGDSKTPAVQGILGIGPQLLELPGTDDFANQLALVSGLPNAFTFQACDPNSRGSGFLTFGGYNPNFVSQDPEFVELLTLGANMPYYAVTVNSVGLGNAQVASNIGPTIVDTGTSQLLLPTSAFNAFMNALSQNSAATTGFSDVLNGGCTVTKLSRAQVDAQLPQMSIAMDVGNGKSTTLTLSASKSYLIPLASTPDSETAGAYCLAVGDGGDGQFSAILGNTVMRGLSVVFDLGNAQVGFAPSTGCPVTLS